MLLIFDWDGTLSDSVSKIVDCMQKAADSAGLPILDEEPIRNIIGLGLNEAITALYPDLNQVEHDRLKTDYARHFVSQDQIPSPFFDGVLEGLTNLRDSHFTLAIATGKSRRGLDRVLKNLKMETFFHATRCADETASKPHPQMLIELLDEFAIDANQALMVGDTEYDMAMAESIDMPRVGTSYGAHSLERLKKYHLAYSFSEFNNFVDWVQAQYLNSQD